MKIGPKHGELPAIASISSSGKGSGGAIGGKVTEKYFGMQLGDCQSADEPYDPNSKTQTQDGVFKTGRGSQGGGSKMTPQIKRMVTGSGTRSSKVKVGSSIPRNTQKLRG